tara:strand:+ start:171 stop:623 length:453 start_codon:yes stop_codon:yes gene_type:complete
MADNECKDRNPLDMGNALQGIFITDKLAMKRDASIDAPALGDSTACCDSSQIFANDTDCDECEECVGCAKKITLSQGQTEFTGDGECGHETEIKCSVTLKDSDQTSCYVKVDVFRDGDKIGYTWVSITDGIGETTIKVMSETTYKFKIKS